MNVKLFYRQKVLLSLLQAFGGKLSKLDMQKYLFLFTKEFQNEPSYEFVPYNYGCFSFQSYADRRNLTEKGLFTNADSWELATDDNFISTLTDIDKAKLLSFVNQYKNLKGNELVKEVYQKYPYYAYNSKIAENLLEPEEMEDVKNSLSKDESECFFTIGYEDSSFENYLNRLIKNNIKILCDVRKNPISRKYGFSKKTLSETVEKLGIKYIHIPELGIISEKRQTLETQQDYDILFDDYEKTTLKNNDSINYLYQLFKENKRVAITCFEKEVCMCHRGRVAKKLEMQSDWKYTIKHI